MVDPAGGGLRIGLLTASASRLGGGVFEAVAAHCRMLTDLGHAPHVFAIDDDAAAEDRSRFDAPVTLAPLIGPAQIGYAPSLLPALLAADLDVLHLHGIWMYPSLAGARWATRTRRPYVISPHGMLDPWITARGRWKKALAKTGYERASWRAARTFHALTGRESADIRREAGAVRIDVIPNPAPAAAPPRTAMPGPHVVYIGRLHAKKNLLPLIEGWRMAFAAGDLPADATLSIAGWGDADYAAALTQPAGDMPSIRLCGPVYGSEKHALLAEARAVALPSLSEGLPMAMLEAWADGIPTIMTEDCNLPEGFAAGAAMPCGHDADTIAAALTSALAKDEGEWLAMSAAARGLAAGPFGKDSIATRWDRLYRGLAGNAA